jgi:hypothetical protein
VDSGALPRTTPSELIPDFWDSGWLKYFSLIPHQEFHLVKESHSDQVHASFLKDSPFI